jgi:hypothetical protein
MPKSAKCTVCGGHDELHQFDGVTTIIDNVPFLVTIIKCSSCGAVISAFPTPPYKKEDDKQD